MSGTIELAIASVRTDGGTQSRACLEGDVIADYAEAIRGGAVFPPVTLFFDGADHWLADGFHRYHAYSRAGLATMPADVRQGSQRDAILYSVGANASHGLRRTNDDKRRAVDRLLRDTEWGAKSDRWIAEKCGVSDPFVGKLRREVQTVSSSPAKREGRDGKKRSAKPTTKKKTARKKTTKTTTKIVESPPEPERIGAPLRPEEIGAAYRLGLGQSPEKNIECNAEPYDREDELEKIHATVAGVVERWRDDSLVLVLDALSLCADTVRQREDDAWWNTESATIAVHKLIGEQWDRWPADESMRSLEGELRIWLERIKRRRLERAAEQREVQP